MINTSTLKHSVQAYNLSASSENKIHDDSVAKKFGFKEDYDADGSVNDARYEGSRQYKKMMLSTLPQYDIETPLPNYSDTNNEGFADLFKGAKQK